MGDVYIYDTSAGWVIVLSSKADETDALGADEGVVIEGTTITYTVPADGLTALLQFMLLA